MANSNVKFLSGSFSQYSALAVKDTNTLYFVDGQIFKGDMSYSDQIAVVSALPETLVAGKVYVNTTDKSVTYYDGTTSTVAVPATVGTIGDSTPDNDLANVKAIKDFIKAQIAKIPAAKDYTIVLEDTTAGENELTKQILKQGESGKETEVGTISVPKLVMDTSVTENNMASTYKFIYGGVEVGKVNIPKDLVVTQDGSEIIRVDDDHPVSGLNNGVYLKLMIQNSIKPVYIDVKDLGGNDGITPHIDFVTKRWFIGDTDTGILAEGVDGNDGITPNIGANGNWFIGDTDTGVTAQGKDGKSIKSITKDDNNNIIVTFSDNTTQNIGKLSIDVQADFLSSDGFGKLRYYNSHFQYYDDVTSSWVDTSVTPDNVYVMNITPQPMKSISCSYDRKLGKLKLKFKEPADTVIDGQAFCIVEKVVIRRKLGSAPTDENDGDFVLEVLRSSFGSYANEWFIDDGVVPRIGDTYFYKAFPISTTGFYNYSDLNVRSVTCKEAVVYGFRIDQNESDPASMITYIGENENFNPAHMDYTNKVFDYGDWADIWFIKDLKPCMLKYDGTVDYELDKNDYTKKTDGTSSDVANINYEGNAMVGIPKVYYKIVDNGDNTADVYFSEDKVDDNYHCWSHIDCNGNEIDYCYLSMFLGYNKDRRLRSISGYSTGSMTITEQIAYAEANNVSEHIWSIDTYCDRLLVNLLLTLISKTTDTQTAFGRGYGQSVSGIYNTNGLFYGSNGKVKIFGVEDWWGRWWRNMVGWISDNMVQRIKMTYGTSDGSTVNGYNTDGVGYIDAITLNTIAEGYIKSMSFTEYGLFPTDMSGSSTTYYCDKSFIKTTTKGYASAGGCYYASEQDVGTWCTVFPFDISNYSIDIGTGLSCKPTA